MAALGREVSAITDALNTLLDPALLHRLSNVHELHANFIAVDLLQNGKNLPDARLLQAQLTAQKNWPIEFSLGKAVRGRIQFGMIDTLLNAQWVQIGV